MKAPSVFKKRFTEKKFASKISKKLRIDADRDFIEALFDETTDPKSGKKFRVFDGAKVTDAKDQKRVLKLAKEIKRQKGRFNLVSLLAAFAFIALIVLALGVFRNVIAKNAIVAAAENAFGAKCDLESVDFDVFGARFALGGFAVADRNAPMTNLFEIGEAELNIDLLWLTRGKLRVHTGSVTHIAWGTARTASGALSPAKDKAWKERQAAIEAETPAKDTSGGAGDTADVEKAPSGSPVNLSAGFSAVTDMLDPKKILDAEIANLMLPGAVEKVNATVPALTAKWGDKNKTLKAETDAAIAAGKSVTSINPTALKTAADVQAALKKVQDSSGPISTGVASAKSGASEVKADADAVNALKREAEAAYKYDSARLAALSASIKAANLQEGTKVLSSVFETFASATLGEWYPKAERAFAMVAKFQKVSKLSKTQSLKKKSGALSRLPGRDVAFGVKDAPRVLIETLELGVDSAAVSGSGTLTDVTDDQELSGKPTGFAISLSHGPMSERFDGEFDLREGTATALRARFEGAGYGLSIPATGAPGVPSVKGTLSATGTLAVNPRGDAIIESKLVLDPANISAAQFEPTWAFDAYKGVLSGMKTLDADLDASIPRNGDPSIAFDTEADRVLGAAIASSVSDRIAGLKKDVQKEANAWLSGQQGAYSAQISKFTSITGITPQMATNALAYENAASTKKAELEKRAKDLAAAQVESAAADAQKKAGDAIKKLF